MIDPTAQRITAEQRTAQRFRCMNSCHRRLLRSEAAAARQAGSAAVRDSTRLVATRAARASAVLLPSRSCDSDSAAESERCRCVAGLPSDAQMHPLACDAQKHAWSMSGRGLTSTRHSSRRRSPEESALGRMADGGLREWEEAGDLLCPLLLWLRLWSVAESCVLRSAGLRRERRGGMGQTRGLLAQINSQAAHLTDKPEQRSSTSKRESGTTLFASSDPIALRSSSTLGQAP